MKFKNITFVISVLALALTATSNPIPSYDDLVKRESINMKDAGLEIADIPMPMKRYSQKRAHLRDIHSKNKKKRGKREPEPEPEPLRFVPKPVHHKREPEPEPEPLRFVPKPVHHKREPEPEPEPLRFVPKPVHHK